MSQVRREIAELLAVQETEGFAAVACCSAITSCAGLYCAVPAENKAIVVRLNQSGIPVA